MYLVIAEKPSVSRAIAEVIGAQEREDGYLQGTDCMVSWCFGHLAEYVSPDVYDEKFNQWRYEDLPIIPKDWKVTVSEDKKDQFYILKRLLNSPEIEYVVNACDELKEDMLKIGGYKITPKGSISLFKEIDFKIAQTEYSYTILISKKPLKWLYKKFYVTIYGRHGKVKKIELVRADKKYSTKYETMNGTVLEKLQEENNRFLRKCLGTPSKKSMTGVEYYYEWGQIQSFYDDRSCQTGIVIMF